MRFPAKKNAGCPKTPPDFPPRKDGILHPRRVVLGLPSPSARVCTGGRVGGRTYADVTTKISRIDSYPISFPESLGFLIRRRCQKRLWGNGKNVIFLIGCSGLFTVTKLRTVNCRIPAVTLPLSQSLSWRRPLTKKPEDSGYEILGYQICLAVVFRWRASHAGSAIKKKRAEFTL